jgi:hypothetical protein
VLLARAGAAVAVVLAFRAGRRLGGTGAGLAAAAAVALCGGFLGLAAAGAEAGLTIAFALAAVEAWRAGRPRAALGWGAGAALLRVEAWPFLLAAAVAHGRRRPADRPALVAGALVLPALWLVPELLGSGELLRSAERARVPNAGQPATAAVPALAALGQALAVPPWPVWLGLPALLALREARAARPLAALGLAWIALVAAMAQAGFSGERRYALPGAALVAAGGAVGLVAVARRHPALAAGAAVVGAVAAAPPLAGLADLRREQAHQRGLAADLRDVIAAGGGREALLACGTPYVGHLRGPLLAYHLEVEKRRVAFAPAPPGTLFRSRLRPSARVEPAVVGGFAPRARRGRWELRVAC